MKSIFMRSFTFLLIFTMSMGTFSAPGGNANDSSGGNKASICHFDEDAGLFHVVTINQNAVDKHFSNHGDTYPGEFYTDTDGDGLGDPLGSIDLCPNPGFVNNALDQCPADAAGTDDGCPVQQTLAGTDLVVTNGQWWANSNNGNILYGDGAGNFTLQSYSTRLGGQVVTVADFNGDGNDDFVQAGYDGNGIYVGLSDGAGNVVVSQTTTLQPDQWTGAGPQAIASGDLDNDGDLDLAIGVQGYYVYVLENDGNAVFTQVLKLHNGATRNRAVSVADFDGDGAADIAAIEEGGGIISIFYGDTALGINFDPVITFGLPCSNKMQVADFDGDGRPDIATGSWCSAGIHVYLNDGTPDLSTPAVYGGFASMMMQAVDLDSDGATDLIVGENDGLSNLVQVYYNDGTGVFGSPVSYPVTNGLGASAIGDFNEDGSLDLAIANRNAHTVTVLEGNSAGGFAAENIITSGNFTYPESIAAGNFD